MHELIQAAKAVIEWWEDTEPSDLPIEQLIAAVERAESAQLAERERIKQIITYQFGELVTDLDDVFAMIDDDTEAQSMDPTLPAGDQGNPENPVNPVQK